MWPTNRDLAKNSLQHTMESGFRALVSSPALRRHHLTQAALGAATFYTALSHAQEQAAKRQK